MWNEGPASGIYNDSYQPQIPTAQMIYQSRSRQGQGDRKGRTSSKSRERRSKSKDRDSEKGSQSSKKDRKRRGSRRSQSNAPEGYDSTHGTGATSDGHIDKASRRERGKSSTKTVAAFGRLDDELDRHDGEEAPAAEQSRKSSKKRSKKHRSKRVAQYVGQGPLPDMVHDVDDILYPYQGSNFITRLWQSQRAEQSDGRASRAMNDQFPADSPRGRDGKKKGNSNIRMSTMKSNVGSGSDSPRNPRPRRMRLRSKHKSGGHGGRNNGRNMFGRGGMFAGIGSSIAYFVSSNRSAIMLVALMVAVVVPIATLSSNISMGNAMGTDGLGAGTSSGGATVSTSPYLGFQPNIIIIFPDDNGYNDVNFTNPGVWKPFSTPNLDKLAFNNGVRLDTYYTASTCTPARCSVLTGRYIPRTGCYQDADLDSPWGLPLTETLISDHMQSAGYYTAMFGKWHLGSFHNDFVPTSRGFNHFVGFLGGGGDYYEHTDGGGYDWWYDDAVDQSVDGTYSTYVLNSSIQTFIYGDGLNNQPWFMYLPTKVPHGDYSAPDAFTQYFGDYDGDTQAWLAEIMMLDDLIGSIVYYLMDTSQYENTVIIYAGDHGSENDNPDYGGSGRTYPFSGGKGNNYEGGIRTPSFVHSTHLHENIAGTKVTDIASVYDWLPTVCALAGIDPSSAGNDIDGWNLAPWLFKGKTLDGHDYREVLMSLEPCDNKKKSTEQKRTRRKEGGEGEDMDDGNDGPATTLRYGQYKMHAGCVDPDNGPEWYSLYDIVNDPTESTELLQSDNSGTYDNMVSYMVQRLMYFASVAVDPNDVCDGCSEGCANDGIWGPFYDENYDYTNYC